MKRVLFILVVTAIGFAVGIAASLLFTAFIPICGEYCASTALAYWLFDTVGAILVFGSISVMLSRRAIPSMRLSIRLIAILSALFIAPAAGHYVYTLHSIYLRLAAIAPVQPDIEFLHMVIATRRVQGVTGADPGAIKPLREISQWERCVIGTARCENPKQAQMRCKGGVVYVNENDWSAFSLIQKENLPGTIPLDSMQLCGK